MDEIGKIYGLTPDGIFTYDYATNTFENTFFDMSRKKLFPMDFVVINAGQVAVGTSSSGLMMVDLKTKKTTLYEFEI